MKTSHTIPTLQASEFESDVLKSDQPIVVEFGAPWCAPCRAVAPALVSACAEAGVRVVSVDTDAEPALASSFGVRALPTMVAFSDGAPIASFRGAGPRQALLGWIRQFQEDLSS